jgi:hypothetical protein
MLMAAFGMSLAGLVDIAKRVISAKDVKLVILALTSAVQIRANAVFVGTGYADIRKIYPELVIEGDRGLPDQFNFSALHALGHLFAHMMADGLGRKILNKAGSCITGEGTTDDEAGKINKEVAASWTPTDRAEWQKWTGAVGAEAMLFLDPIAKSVSQKATEFVATSTKSRGASVAASKAVE